MGKTSKVESQIQLTGDWARYGGDSLLVSQTIFIQRVGTSSFDIVVIKIDDEDNGLFSIGSCYVNVTDASLDIHEVKKHFTLNETVSDELLAVKICEYYECDGIGCYFEDNPIEQLRNDLRDWGIAR